MKLNIIIKEFNNKIFKFLNFKYKILDYIIYFEKYSCTSSELSNSWL